MFQLDENMFETDCFTFNDVDVNFEFAEEPMNPQKKVNEYELHDVVLESEAGQDNIRVREDDEELVDSDYTQDDDDCIPEKFEGKGKEPFAAGPLQVGEKAVDSDIEWSDAEFSSECESEKDVYDRVPNTVRPQYFNPDTDMVNPRFKLGMVFPSADDFKKAIREYAILSNRSIRFTRNESRRVRAVCKSGCSWVVFASSIGDNKIDKSIVVKTYNGEHTCTRVFEKKWISSTWLANKFGDRWIDDPLWKMNSFFTEVRKKMGVQVSPWTFYRTRKKALNKIQGSVDEQYQKLWDYCDALKESNPGTTVKIKLSSNTRYPQFERLYICFAACKKGWLAGCRRIIGLDGCHIKGPHDGQLLAAIGIDGDNSMYPIAYAVVESECANTWTWFLEFLTNDLEITNTHTVTWITDKQKGLIDSVLTSFPNSEHRFVLDIYITTSSFNTKDFN